MSPSLRATRPGPRVLPLLALLAFATPARAQIVKPWVPSGDSLLQTTTTARMRFQHQQGDSIEGENYGAFELVGQVGRKLLRALGPEHMLQAPAIEATLDSLGLDVEVVSDPTLPSIVLMLVRNPFRVTSQAVGFLYWYRQDDLRLQGASFPSAHGVQLRAWWSGRPDSPYEVGIVWQPRQSGAPPGMKLLRMSPDGYYWNLVQYEGHGPELGRGAQATFTDVNHDGQPELLVFNLVDPDSFFVLRDGVPPIVNEFLYTERPEGYVLHNARTVPGPLEALRAFAELLQDHQVERAKRLMLKPEHMAEAIANGWSAMRAHDSWVVEYGEAQPWPEWFEVRTHAASGYKRWIFHFYIRDGLWVIRDWIPVHENPDAHRVVPLNRASADSSRGHTP